MTKNALVFAALLAAVISPAFAGTTEAFFGINQHGNVTALSAAEAHILGNTTKYGEGWAVWDHIPLQVFDSKESGAVPVCRHANAEQGGYFLSLNCDEELIPGDSRWKKNWAVFHAKTPSGGFCPAKTVAVYSWVNTPKTYAGTKYQFVPADSPWEANLVAAGWNEVSLEFCLPSQTSQYLTPATNEQEPGPVVPAAMKTQFRAQVEPNQVTIRVGTDGKGNAVGFLSPFRLSDVAKVCLWQTDKDGWWFSQCGDVSQGGDSATFLGTPSEGCGQAAVILKQGGEVWSNLDALQATGLPLVKKTFNKNVYDNEPDQCLAWGGWTP